jgi:hypothetical protein
MCQFLPQVILMVLQPRVIFRRRSCRVRRRNQPAVIFCDTFHMYVRAYSQPGALKGCFNDYRAAPEDTAQDLEDASDLISCPILTLWGAGWDSIVFLRFSQLSSCWAQILSPLAKCLTWRQCGGAWEILSGRCLSPIAAICRKRSSLRLSTQSCWSF